MRQVLLFTNYVSSQRSRHSLYQKIANLLHEHSFAFSYYAYHETVQSEFNPLLRYEVQKARHIPLLRALQIISIIAKLNKGSHVLISGYGHWENWLALFMANISGITCTAWLGACHASTKTPKAQYLKKFFLRYISSIVTYGQSSSNFYVDLGFPSKRIITGMNCSDTDYFSFSGKDRLLVDPQCKIKLIYVGRISPEKGIIEFVNHIKANPDILDLIEFQIYGGGPLESELHRITLDVPMINFKGTAGPSQVRAALNSSSVLIQPTFYDPYSRVLSEAVGCGCYVISSIFDTSSEVLTEAHHQLFDPYDFRTFRKAFFECVGACKNLSLTKAVIANSSAFSTDFYAKAITRAILISSNK